MSRDFGAYERAQASTAQHFQRQDKGLSPVETRMFIRLEPATAEALLTQLDEDGSLSVSTSVLYEVANAYDSMTVEELLEDYQENLRQDESIIDPEEREDLIMAATPGSTYCVLCMLVGAGLGLWAET
jgi:hypothetical protein